MIATTLVLRRLVCWTISFALSLALVVTSTSSASASPLLIGTSILATGETDPFGGAAVGSVGPVPFATADYSGTLTSTVLAGDASNPFGPGALTFTYLLSNDALSTGEIERLTVNDFAGNLVDASYQTPPAGVPPTLSTRSGLSDLGNVVGFSFFNAPVGLGALTPGTSSALLVVQTNATTFAPSVASVIDGYVTTVASLAPGGPGGGVPEPCSVMLAGIGMAGIAIFGRRRCHHVVAH